VIPFYIAVEFFRFYTHGSFFGNRKALLSREKSLYGIGLIFAYQYEENLIEKYRSGRMEPRGSRYWETAFREAEEYRKTCLGGLGRRNIFTPRILYNILALSAEKYCMALFYSRSIMPENHTFHDLANALKEVLGDNIDKDFLESFRDLDTPQADMCSLGIFKPQPLNYSQIEIYVDILDRLREMIRGYLPQAAVSTLTA